MDIKYKYETKFLGLHVTEDIKWDFYVVLNFYVIIKSDVHVKNLRSKFSKNYYGMQSLKGVTSQNILRSMYFTNFHSHPSGEVMGKVNNF